MSDLITPDDLPRWVPGETTVDSARLGWQGVRIRGYRYTPLDVPIPGIREYLIVVYKNGATTMNRRSTGDWRNEPVVPGCVSLLTHTAQSHWRWSEDIEVRHLYLSPQTMADVAAEAYERHIKDVELRDILKADDPVLTEIAASLAREAQAAGLGGGLYVEALRNHACVHILRHYADVVFREPSRSGALSRAQCHLLNQYFEENLDRNFSLAELAGVVQLSVFHFTRKFRTEFGCPPTCLCHAEAHRARQGPTGSGECSAQGRRGQQWILGPKPYDASVPTPARRHASSIPQGGENLNSSGRGAARAEQV